ncbi:hypothetical protein [Reichenbachiella versicolor]|uniref:hypothetical protein n=1 Tax=Reichenbachiella versicolor TaxID=1821036 RepID=UPI000D6DF4CD|nr:hypothetical protein [Reichenbachiella versicolor]
MGSAITILIIILLLYWAIQKPATLINRGKLLGTYRVSINDHEYYIEEVEFKGYQEALHNYFKIVYDIDNTVTSKNVKFDLYDWSFNIWEIENSIIEIRHFRSFNKVRLVKSLTQLTMEEYEKDNMGLVEL